MSNQSKNNITITGKRVQEIYNKIKTNDDLFSAFYPAPDIFEDWNAKDPTNVTYTMVFDKGLETELRVEDTKVDAADLNKVLAENPMIQYRQGSNATRGLTPTQDCYVPMSFWNIRWRQENWGRDRETTAMNLELIGDTLTFSCNTRYSPPSYFLQRLSKDFGVNVSVVYDAEVCCGKKVYENGVKTEDIDYDYDLDLTEDDERAHLVYNKEWINKTPEERAEVQGKYFRGPDAVKLEVEMYSDEVLTFRRENKIGPHNEEHKFQRGAVYFVKKENGEEYVEVDDGSPMPFFLHTPTKNEDGTRTLFLVSMFGESHTFVIGGPNDESNRLEHT